MFHEFFYAAIAGVFSTTTVIWFWSGAEKKSALETMKEFEAEKRKFDRKFVKKNYPNWQGEMNEDYKHEDTKGIWKKIAKSVGGFALAIIPWAIPGVQPIAPITTGIGLGMAGYDITNNTLGAIDSKDRRKKWDTREKLVDDNT